MPMPSPKNNFYRTLSLSSKANEEANGIGTGNSSLPLKNSQSINYTRDTPNSIEIDTSSLDELSRFEQPEKPPGLEQLQALTHNRFSNKWLKYMYAKFKNECPSGRMRFSEFKRLFGAYIPDRINDAYLERLFHAFCYVSSYSDQITFKDLVICLSRLCDDDARANAEWTMQLINRNRCGQIVFQEFYDFVKSIFMLVGRSDINARKIRSGSLLMNSSLEGGGTFGKTPTVRSVAILASAITTPCAAPSLTIGSGASTTRTILNRASIVFKELDHEEKGYLTVEDLESFFREKQAETLMLI